MRPKVIACYAPMPDEPGGADLPEMLAAHGRVLLPVLQPDLDLDWAYFTGHFIGPGPLAAGSSSVGSSSVGSSSARSFSAGSRLREPAGPRVGLSAIGGADLVVVPALAVDRAGVRLGRGGGSYDRALARARPDALTVALLYDGELVDDLPGEPHDARVGAVILPSLGLTRLPIP